VQKKYQLFSQNRQLPQRMPHILYPNSHFFRHAVPVFANMFQTLVYRAYAIRPYKSRKTNTAKTTFDVGKTMSYVEKIMSDVIQTTSDIIFTIANN